jgi:hypothetical protein
MHHNITDEAFDVSLQKLRLFSCQSEIRITTVDTQSIECGTGTFSIQTPHASLTVGKNGDDSGFIDLRTSGPNADIVLEADSTAECVSLLTLNKAGILGVFGPPAMPAFIRLDGNAVTLGKGLMLPGPALGGKISLTDTAVVIQAGLAKISVTPAGVVIEVGGTTFELSLAGIKQAVGITEMQVDLTGITQKCAENIVLLNAVHAKYNAAMVNIKALFEILITSVVQEHYETCFIDHHAPMELFERQDLLISMLHTFINRHC